MVYGYCIGVPNAWRWLLTRRGAEVHQETERFNRSVNLDELPASVGGVNYINNRSSVHLLH